MRMYRYTNILFALSVALVASCAKVDKNDVYARTAAEFSGVIETSLEVDLGLSAKWAAYNVGADAPQNYGSYYAWGESRPKDIYTVDNYRFYNAETSTYNLVAGQRFEPSDDAATLELGYGWYTPTVSDVQELIDNCDNKAAEYRGVFGWVATSRVPGFEGKSIFFPAAGYAAEDRKNNTAYQSLFWVNEIVDVPVSDSYFHAANVFFSGSSMLLNTPPKGVGGLAWCGYPVRGVRKFFLDIDASGEIGLEREILSYTFNIYGNTRWSVSINGEGASVNPSSGEGQAEVTISLPENNTYDFQYFDVAVSSGEAEAKTFKLTHFGFVPDFKFEGEASAELEWDGTASSFSLRADDEVSWTAEMLLNGAVAEGASVTPSFGSGSSSFEVTLPENYDIFENAVYELVLTTDNYKIPDALREIKAQIIQKNCAFGPFGTLWSTSFLKSLQAAVEAEGAAESYLIENINVIPNVPGTITADGKYVGKAHRMYFNAAQDGDALLSVYALVARASTEGNPKRISVSVNDAYIDRTTLLNASLADNLSGTFEVFIPNVKKGDKIGLHVDDSGNHRIYSVKWDRFSGVMLDHVGAVVVSGDTQTYKFNVRSNGPWTASVTGDGVSLSPASGNGSQEVTVNMPQNETDESLQYVINVKSLDSEAVSTSATFTIEQKTQKHMDISKSGVVTVGADVTSLQFNVSANVAWTATVTGEGAMVSPASGSSDAALMVSFPANASEEESLDYLVTLTTDSPAVEEKVKSFTIRQSPKENGTKFGTQWKSAYITSWSQSGFAANVDFTTSGLTCKTSGSLTTGTKGYMRGNYTVSFTVGESGTGVLTFRARLAGSGSGKTMTVKQKSGSVENTVYSRKETTDITDDYSIEIMVVKGDVITISASGSNNHQLYCGDTYPICWTKK